MGLALRLTVGEVWTVVPVAIVMILAYLGASLLLGIGDDERWVARSFLKSGDALAA